MRNETNFTPYDIVRKFEETIARYAGSKYAVAVDSCCNALFLCCVYRKIRFASIPKYTYPGVACAILNAISVNKFFDYDRKISFTNVRWGGVYNIAPHRIVDGALRFRKGMYVKKSLHCLSFHYKKHLPIGRGGMILTDDFEAYQWLKRARFDGRSEVPLQEDDIEMVGWNMYMTPEQAAKGLTLFAIIKDKDLMDINSRTQGYPDLSTISAYRGGL